MKTFPQTFSQSSGTTEPQDTEEALMTIDLRGLVPAPVTPFNRDGSVDVHAIHRLGGWLAGVEGVKGLVVLGHAGEGTFLTQDEQALVIREFKNAVNGEIPIIAGITGEGNMAPA